MSACIIHAKRKSVRLPEKNLISLEEGGPSLVRMALEKAILAGFECVILDTEDDKIAQEANGLDGIVQIYKRDPKLASNSVSANDLLQNILRNTGIRCHEVIFQHFCTSPTLAIATMTRMREFMDTHPDINSIVLVDEKRGHEWTKVHSIATPLFNPGVLPNTNDCPAIFFETHGLYGQRTSAFRGDPVIVCPLEGRTPSPTHLYPLSQSLESIDVDTELDLDIARTIYQKHKAYIWTVPTKTF